MKLKTLFYILLLSVYSFSAFAVSEKDMENAKVIAAKLYLRWTNNASGYLDDISASSMADLESKLKTQETENLKAFKSVPIPADYASWDKERFVQFWGTTFFTSPALSADGKRAKDRVKAKVKTLNVAAPTSAPAPVSENPAPETKQEENKADNAAQGEAITIPEATEVVHDVEAAIDSMAVIQAEEQSVALADQPEKAKSRTWLYVAILVVLVILVVCLMIYAINMLKRQNVNLKDDRQDNADTSSFRKEIKSLEASNIKLRDENTRLKNEMEAAKAEIARLRAAARKTEEKQEVLAAQVTTLRPKKEEPKPQPKIINEIFLGRANPKGLFVRGDRRPNPDFTVFRLNTKDGIVGTFRFVETPESFALVTSNPLQFLAGGCICENFEDAETASRIVTENPGTAILENGCWKVLRKSKIRFE